MQNRLPNTAKPQRYEIFIHPNFEDFTFRGEEVVELEVLQATERLVLHSADLKIHSAKVIHTGGVNWEGEVSYNKKDETTTFTFPKTLQKGPIKLELKFKGEMNDKMRGFYRSKFTHNGVEKHLGVTQLEATDARRAFPCFDEPSQKAVFELTLMIPKGMKAVSNTIESTVTEDQSGFQVIKFEPTPKMPTYLLAFIIGELEWVEGKTSDGILVRIFTTPGKKSQGQFALETTIKCLEFYEDYFGIKYPLPSLDMVAIPDFSASAMENWGAITYRESALLVDQHTSSVQKQRVAIVIAHELAHQWFGDLVTMEWWTHLWLNEGFASYMEYLASDSLFPEWDLWTQFAYMDQGVALKLDSLENTHPIEVEVHHPKEIAEVFDTVSYSKGASVIRMLADYLGKDVFRKGLSHYLKKHQYQNARTEDLWKALGEVSGKDVEKIMKEWTSKPGYPLIEVKTLDGKLKLTQQRFFSSPFAKKDSSTWPVPIDGRLMEGKTLLVKDQGKVNKGESGFFRVAYQEELLKRLENGVAGLQTVDRLGLIRDAFDLSEPGYYSTDQALEMAESYVDEEDYTVWIEIASHISGLSNLFYWESFHPNLGRYTVKLFSKIALKLGWQKKKGEKHTSTMLRSLVLHQMGAHGDKETIAEAQKLFKKILSGGEVEADIKGVVYNLAAENGGDREFKEFSERYIKEESQQEKDRLTAALSSFKNPKLLQKTLKFSLSKHVRFQDSWIFVVRVWMNPEGRDLAWEYVKKNWEKLHTIYQGGHYLSRLIQGAEVFTTSKKAKEVEQFFKDKDILDAKRSLAQALEQIYINENWIKRDKAKIAEFLEKI